MKQLDQQKREDLKNRDQAKKLSNNLFHLDYNNNVHTEIIDTSVPSKTLSSKLTKKVGMKLKSSKP